MDTPESGDRPRRRRTRRGAASGAAAADAGTQEGTGRRRRSISRTTRFEVFKRDQFTCQYCGRKAPEVVLEVRPLRPDGRADLDAAGADGGAGGEDEVRLHVDHIEPLALGGADDILNYVTACEQCNLGKGARPLSDDSVMTKRRRQLDELAARREQLEMLYAWQQALGDIAADTVERLAAYWADLAPGYVLNTHGRKQLTKLTDEFGVDEIMAAMRTAATKYLEHDASGAVTRDSWVAAWRKVGGVCRVTRDMQTDPDLKRLLYIRGILRNQFPDRIDLAEAIRLLKRGRKLGWDLDWMQEQAIAARSYYRWRRDMEEMIAADEAEAEAATPPAPASVAPAAAPPVAAPATGQPGHGAPGGATIPPPRAPTPRPADVLAAVADVNGYLEVPLGSDALRGVGIEVFADGASVDVSLAPVTLCGVRASIVAQLRRAADIEALEGLVPPEGAGAAIAIQMDWAPARDPAARLAAARVAWAAQGCGAWPAASPSPGVNTLASPYKVFWAMRSGDDVVVVEGGYLVWVRGDDLDEDLRRTVAIHARVIEWATHRFPLAALPYVPDTWSDRVQPIPADAVDRIDLAVVDTLPAGLRLGVGDVGARADETRPALDFVTTGRPDMPLVALLEDVVRPPYQPTVAYWLEQVAALRANRESLAAAGLADLVVLPPDMHAVQMVLRLLAIPTAKDDGLERALASFAGAWRVGANVATHLAVSHNIFTDLGRVMLRDAFGAREAPDEPPGTAVGAGSPEPRSHAMEPPAVERHGAAPGDVPHPSAGGQDAHPTAPAASRRAPPAVQKPGRNAACPCGSGRKFKRCCGRA